MIPNLSRLLVGRSNSLVLVGSDLGEVKPRRQTNTMVHDNKH